MHDLTQKAALCRNENNTYKVRLTEMKNLLGSKDVELWTLRHEKDKINKEIVEMQHEIEN